ncbi:hypothetical protein [Actinomadura macrotermitis]|uniref:hypothetical protein n=1 Tax=Actinomadura macrotermitis TaxID=2585200 RepID=UPI001296A959|nr:hypothetical protein [Actinomadura macrotermitis]
MITKSVLVRCAVGVVLALGVAASVSPPAGAAGRPELQAAVNRLTGPDGAPGALAQIGGRSAITSADIFKVG